MYITLVWSCAHIHRTLSNLKQYTYTMFSKDARNVLSKTLQISSHRSPLTLAVVWAPQMTLQQYLSTFSCLLLPSGSQTPLLSILLCYLLISSSVFLSFLLLSLYPAELSLPCQRISRCGHTIWISDSSAWYGDYHVRQLHSRFWCEPPRLSLGLCRKCSEVPIASYLKGLDPSFNFCCQCPALTGIKEGG